MLITCNSWNSWYFDSGVWKSVAEKVQIWHQKSKYQYWSLLLHCHPHGFTKPIRHGCHLLCMAFSLSPALFDIFYPSLHTLRTKSPSKHLFWCFSFLQIGDWCQYLEGPISTWKDHNRNVLILLYPNIPIVAFPGTDWSCQVSYFWQAEATKKVL